MYQRDPLLWFSRQYASTSYIGVRVYNYARIALVSGTKLGAYEIRAPLGTGGMGEVIAPRTRNSAAMWRSTSIFASSSETALPDLANVSDQSSGRDCGHRLFHRANGDLPDFFVFVVLSHHRPRIQLFGVTEHPSLGWFCIPFAHISRTLTFYVSSSSLPFFSLQASVAHPRWYEPKN